MKQKKSLSFFYKDLLFKFVMHQERKCVPTDSSLHGGLECGATPKLTRNPKFSCCGLI